MDTDHGDMGEINICWNQILNFPTTKNKHNIFQRKKKKKHNNFNNQPERICWPYSIFIQNFGTNWHSTNLMNWWATHLMSCLSFFSSDWCHTSLYKTFVQFVSTFSSTLTKIYLRFVVLISSLVSLAENNPSLLIISSHCFKASQPFLKTSYKNEIELK